MGAFLLGTFTYFAAGALFFAGLDWLTRDTDDPFRAVVQAHPVSAFVWYLAWPVLMALLLWDTIVGLWERRR